MCGDLNRNGVTFAHITKNIRFGKNPQYSIVSDVSGKCDKQEMWAIMGRSGSGKTTLLQILGGRVTRKVTGSVTILGQPYCKAMRTQISYVWQQDIFFPSPTFTVHDQLIFEAYVKMPSTTPRVEILERVDSVMKEMKIDHRADTSLQVISGGEQRRTSIAKELLSDPTVLLVDEGTSGLDSAAAFDLLLKLQSLARDKQIPVIAVIHQPSSRAFHLFDTVLMMSEGCCVYRGPPAQCMSYLASVGVAPPENHCNPADFMLDLLFSQELDSDGMWPRHKLYYAWRAHEAQSGAQAIGVGGGTDIEQKSTSPVAVSEMESDSNDDGEEYSNTVEYKSSYRRQVHAVLVRSFKASSAVEFGIMNILQTVFMAMLVGLCWFQTPHQESRISDLAGYVLFTIAYWFFAGMFEGMLEFLPERVALRRELSSGDYRLSAYFIAKTLASAPVRVLLPLGFVTLSYFMVDAQASLRAYLAFSALVVFATLVGNSVGAFVGCLTSNYHVATRLTTVVALSMLVVGGFYLTHLPPWLSFLGYFSAFRYSYRASIQVLFKFKEGIRCMGGFWIYACRFDPYGTIGGDAVIDYTLGADLDPLGVNIGVMCVYFVSFRVFAYFALLYGEYNTLFKRI